ncbi:hypothetical protein ACLI1A_12750 [Flavobacterium sp. RHBU_3]|uniref:hypothetical protein n=1 Tax=Flavobacterium sp. RHBU_3 TaxID=3391184 RepID=UPI003985059C
MDISSFLYEGLKINGIFIYPEILFEQLDEYLNDYFINEQTTNQKIITYKNIEFCFIDDKLYYWQIDTYERKLLLGKNIKVSGLGFKDFLKFLNKKKVKWAITRELSFDKQITVRITETNVDFVFSFEEKTSGKIEIIGYTHP